jgi:Papain fold toxin 2
LNLYEHIIIVIIKLHTCDKSMNEEQLAEIKQIAKRYRNFQCVPCSQSIQSYLTREGINGKLIKISTQTDRLPFSIITNPAGSDRQIATNGFHQGTVVETTTELGILETVFDNLYPDGIPKDDWLKSFGGPLVEDFNGNFAITETEF